ncbi:MAG: hypothetical protein NVS3B8_15910 [Chitinophagaceae bacterium]
MVDVALSTSIITTIALLMSYSCKSAGEKEVNNEGLSLLIIIIRAANVKHYPQPLKREFDLDKEIYIKKDLAFFDLGKV